MEPGQNDTNGKASVSEEDQRQLHRELVTLTKERTRQVNRIKGLLASQGIKLSKIELTFSQDLEAMKLWDLQTVRSPALYTHVVSPISIGQNY